MTDDTPSVHTVVKVGGGLLGTAGAFEVVIEALTAFRRGRRLVVLPGGGPFADAVRRMFKRVKIGEDAAHWMAELGMDQYAHALAARLREATLVDGDGGISAAIQSGLEGRAPRRLGRAGPPRVRAIVGPSVPRHTPRPARPRYRRRASARARGPGRRGLRRARRTIPRRARPRPRRPPQPGTRLRTRAHAWSRYRAARRPRRCARRRRRRARAAGSPRSASPHRRPAPTESPQPSPPPVERHPPAEPPAPRS